MEKVTMLRRFGLPITLLVTAAGAPPTSAHPWWNAPTPAAPILQTLPAASSAPATPPAGPSLPSLAPIVGDAAGWSATSGDYSMVKDGDRDVLSVEKDNLTLESRGAYPAGVEVRALLRFRTTHATNPTAMLYVGRHTSRTNGKPVDRSLLMAVGANTAGHYLMANCAQDDQTLHDLDALTKAGNWSSNFANGFQYYPRAYTDFKPAWPDETRSRIESDMMAIPALDQKWILLRIELKPGEVRFWMDDRLVAWKRDADLDPRGTIKLWLTPGMQLANVKLVPLRDAPGFQPIRLDGYLNGRGLPDGSRVDAAALPPRDEQVRVKGIPFIFPTSLGGESNLDISRSLYRDANLIGNYDAMYGDLATWPGSMYNDPARVEVRIPNANYNALYIVAAAGNQPDTVPSVTASFYRPGAGFSQSFESRVPLSSATSGPRDAVRLPVRLENGKSANLWLVKIPLDPGMLSSFADLDIVEIEFSKPIALTRMYPDPILYGYHQAGLPSSVHIFAATLTQTPIDFDWRPDVFGHVWTSPALPSYTATVTNHTGERQTGRLRVTARSYDGMDRLQAERTVELPAVEATRVTVPLSPKLFGYYDITATLEIAGQSWTERRSFVELAPDTRSARWTEGRGAQFGFWSYLGGHNTPKRDLVIDLMTEAGARACEGAPTDPDEMMKAHWGHGQEVAFTVNPQAWAADDNPDPAKIAAFRKEVLDSIARNDKGVPDNMKPDHILYFTENSISRRLSQGNYPEYYGDAPYQYTDQEKKDLKIFFNTARIASEFLRKDYPDRKLLIGWTDPLFPVPLLRAGFPPNLIDGNGLDVPGFERLPEMQLQEQAIHRLYELKTEYAKAGITHPTLQTCEGIFVPTEPGAVSYREQMDIYNRWSLLCMAYGVTRFFSGWFAFDCGNYYGASHYGGCGIQRRVPYCDPKPAYAAYATMTDRLNEANFDGWVPTGSLTTYCLRFKGPRGNVYSLWTIRGKRPVTLTLGGDATVHVTDCMNNTRDYPTADRRVTFTTDPDVRYVTCSSDIASVQVGDPDNSDAAPAPGSRQVADLGDGSWHYTSERDPIYENDHYDYAPAAGKFGAAVVKEAGRGSVLESTLEKQDRERRLMPWYNTLRPAKPIVLPGAPAHIGLWVKGNSDWGRVVYVCRDAHGERWVSCGFQDQYNCNDTHCYNSFNFDGWRYLRFELPGNYGYDSFRKVGTTWWRTDAPTAAQQDNIVDLPLSLEEIIVEQRSHILYVNDVQRAPSDTVRFGKLFVEYDDPADATEDAVRISRLRMPPPPRVALPDPIADMTRDGVGAPTQITALRVPENWANGTNMYIDFNAVPGAKTYYLWVSAHPDGSGAVNLVPGGLKSGDRIFGLRPAVKLYYWVSYLDADGKMSKPSPRFEAVTEDLFKEE